jgi:hypothetical protein
VIDLDALLYDPIYETFGVPAVITPAGSGRAPIEVIVIDRTAGVETGSAVEFFGHPRRSASGVTVATVRPVVALRASELAAKNITPDDLIDGFVTLFGKTWRIKTYAPHPPGEIYLFLLDEDVSRP